MTIRGWNSFVLHLFLGCILIFIGAAHGQEPLPSAPPSQVPGEVSITGRVLDVDGAAIPNAHLSLEGKGTHEPRARETDTHGEFAFENIPAGEYVLHVKAPGFASRTVEDVTVLPGQSLTLPEISLGVEALSSTVNAITQEDLAEQQITEEEHQRILGVLPNFYVSYLPNAAPLTRKQKFKLAIRVSTDPVTFFTTGVTAGIAQAQGDFAEYGPGIGGYGQRYAAIYGDRLGSTFFGAALLPSLFHQDPRYFYLGHGSVVHRALYAASTVVICKGDNGHWQPNYSNVFGNLAAAGLASAWYPPSSRHGVQVTVSDTLLNVATGAFGTLFQEFALRHFTRGGYSHPPKRP